MTASIRSWLGIPYATAKRFQRPVLQPFNPSQSFDRLGPAPLQAGDPSWLNPEAGLSEDCLNLNVWAPAAATETPLPVIVYIYGGGFEYGSNTSATSDASGLARTGRAVGVSLNYRLGPLGWLSLSQYGGVFADATNLGLQDMIAALKWVQTNISHFGGDPGNVTVAGHSAGAYSTTALIAAPAARGLYKRFAAFSGGASRIVPVWWAEELAVKFLAALDIADDPEQLLSLDAKLLADTLIKISPRDIGDRHGVDNTTIGIVDDRLQPGAVLASTPLEVLQSGDRRDIDALFSTTSHEADWWVLNAPAAFDPGSIHALVDELVAKSRIPRSRAQRIVAAYNVNGRTPLEVRGALLTDYFFTLPATRAALAHAAAGGNARLLTIGPAEGAPAVHGTEMYGIVGQERPGRSEEQAVRDAFVCNALVDYAEGNYGGLWQTVTAEPVVQGIGNLPFDPSDRSAEVLRIFENVVRT
ncbi:Carboxylesterase family-domain-containing protein [Boeremia exigua]|uniref:Carboxylesterase family-domain-containing protein n=1 Tax=Boeremia exigua TaxID=749465 RepID=UPI001E8DC0EB|nr:Carboxylesterase family-domain-containing protein [Boeremia exigua]KAH6629703.1 Carboxylesterase family-domain-containing protein [Boeremia exigua]